MSEEEIVDDNRKKSATPPPNTNWWMKTEAAAKLESHFVPFDPPNIFLFVVCNFLIEGINYAQRVYVESSYILVTKVVLSHNFNKKTCNKAF